MTSDEFNAEYRLGQCLTSEGIRSTLAQEARKGRLVLVHELSTGSPSEQRRTEILLSQLAPADAAQVIGTYEVDGAPVVVTKFLLGFTSLPAWLEAAVAQSQTRVIDTRDNPPTLDMAIHDPANYRRRPADPIVAPALEDTSVRPAVAPPRGAVKEGAPAAAVPPPPGPPAAAADTESTESFTRLFGEAGGTQDSGPPKPTAAEPGPGAFTQLFGGSTTPPAATGAPSAAPSEPTPSSEPDSLSADLSTLYTAPMVPSEPSPAAGEPATGDFTRLFGGSEPSRQPAAAPSPPVPATREPLRAAPLAPPHAPPPASPRPEPFLEADRTTPVTPYTAGGAPPPPRLRLDALSATPSLDPVAAPRAAPGAAATGPSSYPPAPFSVHGALDDGRNLAAGGLPARSPSDLPAGERAPVSPKPTPLASPASGGYTEMLTPARPPLAQSPSRLPPAAAVAPPPPRSTLVPLVAGLVIFAVLAVAVVLGFVLTSS